jgi:hypothetical protein
LHSSIVPPNVSAALETLFTKPDESAIVNALTLMPVTLGKEAATAITAFASENNVAIQNNGDWFVVEVRAPDISRVAGAEARAPARR